MLIICFLKEYKLVNINTKPIKDINIIFSHKCSTLIVITITLSFTEVFTDILQVIKLNR